MENNIQQYLGFSLIVLENSDVKDGIMYELLVLSAIVPVYMPGVWNIISFCLKLCM